jgi:hypothetical protein
VRSNVRRIAREAAKHQEQQLFPRTEELLLLERGVFLQRSHLAKPEPPTEASNDSELAVGRSERKQICGAVARFTNAGKGSSPKQLLIRCRKSFADGANELKTFGINCICSH